MTNTPQTDNLPVTETPRTRDGWLHVIATLISRDTGWTVKDVTPDLRWAVELGYSSGAVAAIVFELQSLLSVERVEQQLERRSLTTLECVGDLADWLHEVSSGTDTVSATATDSNAAVVRSLNSRYPEFPLPMLELSGSPEEIGHAHGTAMKSEINATITRLVEIIGPRINDMPELEEALIRRDEFFGTDELAELEGIAAGMGVSPPEVVGYNLGLYPEYIPGCTQFAIPAAANNGGPLLHCVNEDSPIVLLLRDTLTRVTQVRFPDDGFAHLFFGIAGQVGGLNGINNQGIAVSTTILLDRPRDRSEGFGIIHPVLVKRILTHADSIESAVEIVRASAVRASAWSLCISHHPTDQLLYLEYDGRELVIRQDRGFVATTNHCLLQPPRVEVPPHSIHRLERLTTLLATPQQLNGHPVMTPERAGGILRDGYDNARGRVTAHPTMSTIRRIDNQASIVMQPATGDIWTTPGWMAPDRSEEFFHLNVNEIFNRQSSVSPPPVEKGNVP